MLENWKRLLPAAALAFVIGACGDYSRTENAELGAEEKPAIVPDREAEPLDAGLGTPGTVAPGAVEEGLEADRALDTTMQRVP